MSKINDVNRHLVNNDADIMGLGETFLKYNDRPTKLSKNMSWVGKFRKTNSFKGGIGMCMKSNIAVLDDHLPNSNDDTLRLNHVKTAVCVAYFPNDGVNQTQTEAFMFELLKNTTDLQALSNK